jgi:hypothetical protein
MPRFELQFAARRRAGGDSAEHWPSVESAVEINQILLELDHSFTNCGGKCGDCEAL